MSVSEYERSARFGVFGSMVGLVVDVHAAQEKQKRKSVPPSRQKEVMRGAGRTHKARSMPGRRSSVSCSDWLTSCETWSLVSGSMTRSTSAMWSAKGGGQAVSVEFLTFETGQERTLSVGVDLDAVNLLDEWREGHALRTVDEASGQSVHPSLRCVEQQMKQTL